jgi:hypothetical protein
MLVSLDKNKWLYDWMQDRFHNDLLAIIMGLDDVVPRPHKMREGIAKLLTAHGYKTKVTSKFDVIISMKEEEYIILKLKYQ